MQVRQLRRLLLHLPLQAATLADVPNVALSDVSAIHMIDVADELDFAVSSNPWQTICIPIR